MCLTIAKNRDSRINSKDVNSKCHVTGTSCIVTDANVGFVLRWYTKFLHMHVDIFAVQHTLSFKRVPHRLASHFPGHVPAADKM